MISIVQRKSQKAIGNTSLFISFDYDPKKVELIKQASGAVWHKDTKEWEIPIGELAYIIDAFTYLDDIELLLLPDASKPAISTVVPHKIQPYDYQQEGIEWLINKENGILADVQGLGKSLQLIYAAEELKAQKGAQHCLIICGVNTLKQNWKREIQKFSNETVRIIGEKVNSKGLITYASIKDRADELYNPLDEFFIIINVEMLTDSLIADAILNSCNSFDIIAVDEIHRAKATGGSQRSKNLLKLAKIGKYHYALSGTPIINSPLDAYTPLKFIGQERASLGSFKQYYCKFESQFGHMQIVGYKNMETLREEIDQCSIRRSKDVLHLPPKVIIPEYIELDTNQRKFYDDIQNGVVSEADRVEIKTTSLLGLVTRLRQAATCPEVLSSKQLANAKIERACDLVDGIVANGEKVVIFSTFKDPLYALHNMLQQSNPLMCTGDQSDEEINEAINSFQTKQDNKVMLCTTSKMGVGVTLTAATYEIFLDAPWTNAEFEQCCDRCYRIGTTKSVTIYNLIAQGTIDERIQYLLDMKKGISEYMLDDNYNQREELKLLLGLQNSLETKFTTS